VLLTAYSGKGLATVFYVTPTTGALLPVVDPTTRDQHRTRQFRCTPGSR
jgi:hypothetical protein